MAGLWRNNEATKEGKYLVQRRDGTVPEWPYFVIGAKDPCASQALTAYIQEAERNCFDPQYIQDLKALVVEFEDYLFMHGEGDPDAPPHRTDDPETVEKMKSGRSA